MKLYQSHPSPYFVQGPVHEFFRQTNPFLECHENRVECTLSKTVSKEWHHLSLWNSLVFLTAPIRRLFHRYNMISNFEEVGTFHKNISAMHVSSDEFNGIPILVIQNPNFEKQDCVPYKHRLQGSHPKIITLQNQKYLLANFYVFDNRKIDSLLCISIVESDNVFHEFAKCFVARKFSPIQSSKSLHYIDTTKNIVYFFDDSSNLVLAYDVQTNEKKIHTIVSEESQACMTNWTRVPMHLEEKSYVAVMYDQVSNRYFLGTLRLSNESNQDTYKLQIGKRPLQFSPRIDRVTCIASQNDEYVLVGFDLKKDNSMVIHVTWPNLMTQA